MDYMMHLIDVVIIGYGLYLTFITYQMKKTNKIHKIILAEEELPKCKDQEGFIKYMTPVMYVFSIGIAVVAALSLVVTLKIIQIPYFSWINLGIFLELFNLFFVKLKKAREKFIQI